MFCYFFIDQLMQNQEIQAESHPESHLTEVKNLQAELQNTLTALQQEDPAELLDDEKVNNTTHTTVIMLNGYFCSLPWEVIYFVPYCQKSLTCKL